MDAFGSRRTASTSGACGVVSRSGCSSPGSLVQAPSRRPPSTGRAAPTPSCATTTPAASSTALLARGGLGRTDLVAAWRWRPSWPASSTVPSAGEQAFRRLLVLDPDYRGPRARQPGLPRAAGARERVGCGPTAGCACATIDPPRAASRWRSRWWSPTIRCTWCRTCASTGGSAPAASSSSCAGDGLRRLLDEPAPGTTLQYYLEVVNAAGDVLWQAGSASAPLVVRAVARLATETNGRRRGAARRSPSSRRPPAPALCSPAGSPSTSPPAGSTTASRRAARPAAPGTTWPASTGASGPRSGSTRRPA